MENLHVEIAKIFTENNFPNCEIIIDKACDGIQNIPLFCFEPKSNKTEYCNVDILILKDDKIKVIVEIDVSKISPTQICGKFLTSALSSIYCHGLKNIKMDNFVSFIQIVDIKKLKKNTSKIDQFKNIEKSIQAIIPLKNRYIKEYFLLTYEDNASKKKSFISSIKTILSDRLS